MIVIYVKSHSLDVMLEETWPDMWKSIQSLLKSKKSKQKVSFLFTNSYHLLFVLSK